MVKCEVTRDFKLEKFDELKNIQRATSKNVYGELYKDDIFECDEKMADYLSGNNENRYVVIKVIEVKPETKKVEEVVEEPKTTYTEVIKNSKKKKSSKK